MWRSCMDPDRAECRVSDVVDRGKGKMGLVVVFFFF